MQIQYVAGQVNLELMKQQAGIGQAGRSGTLSLDEIIRSCSLLGCGADLAFLVMAAQIQQIDSQVRASLEEMQKVKKVRDALNQEMDRIKGLQDLLSRTNHKDSSDSNAGMDELLNAGGYLEELKQKYPSLDPRDLPDYLDILTCPGGPQGQGLKSFDPDAPDFADQVKAAIPKGSSPNDPLHCPEFVRDYLHAVQQLCQDYQLDQFEIRFNNQTDSVEKTRSGSLWKNEPGVGFRLGEAELNGYLKSLQRQATALDSDREMKNILLNQQLNRKEQVVTQLTNMIKKAHDTQSAIISNLK